MSYENIRADTPGFCCAGEYFYIMKPAPTNMLIQKTSYGDPVMTYPFSHEINLASAGTSFLSLQYDGINFWSLEKRNVSGNLEKERILRRWRIEDFMCVLQDSWRIRSQGNAENLNGKAFAIENYYDILDEACGPGTGNPDRVILTHARGPFFHVTDQFHLSSSQGYGEDIPVATVLNNYTITTAQPIQRIYYPGDKVNLRRDLYFFNNASPALGDASAAVYWFAIPHIDAADPTTLNEPTYKGCHDSGIYEQTQAATFITAEDLDGINQACYTGLIAYVRGQQLIMKRPNMPGGGYNYPGPNSDGELTTGFDYVGTNTEFRSNMASMIMDNAIKNDRVTLWTIYDLAASVHPTDCSTVNIYRLQTGYTYGVLEGSFTGPYNYVVSVMKPMVTSIALTAEPALVVANGVDQALIYATVRDQYGAPISGKRVVFGLTATDSQTKGYFLCPEDISECVEGSFTWLDGTPHAQAEVITGSQSAYPGGPVYVEGGPMAGKAVIEWRAGTKAGLITVLAIVQP
jgi:hypothetical protein